MDDPERSPPGSDLAKSGAIPGFADEPALIEQRGHGPEMPVLLAVPHAGRRYAPSLLKAMRMPEQASLRLEDRHIDFVGREVARKTGAALIVAEAPRALIDLNRSPDDIDWEMVAGGAPDYGADLPPKGRRARSGLGLVPRRLHGLGEIWKSRLQRDELAARIDQVHRPYHAAIATRLESIRDRWGVALLVDLHSMPPLGTKRGPMRAPDFVIGDRFGASCDVGLSRAALETFEVLGEQAAHNRPYAGGYVLERHASVRRGIHAMQIEVCRTAYLDGELREPGPGVAHVGAVLAAIIRRLADEMVGGAAQFREAAE